MLRKKPIFVKMGRLKDFMVTGLLSTNNLLVTKTLFLMRNNENGMKFS